MQCPSLEALAQQACRKLLPRQLPLDLARHLAACKDCLADYVRMAGYARGHAVPKPPCTATTVLTERVRAEPEALDDPRYAATIAHAPTCTYCAEDLEAAIQEAERCQQPPSALVYPVLPPLKATVVRSLLRAMAEDAAWERNTRRAILRRARAAHRA